MAEDLTKQSSTRDRKALLRKHNDCKGTVQRIIGPLRIDRGKGEIVK